MIFSITRTSSENLDDFVEPLRAHGISINLLRLKHVWMRDDSDPQDWEVQRGLGDVSLHNMRQLKTISEVTDHPLILHFRKQDDIDTSLPIIEVYDGYRE